MEELILATAIFALIFIVELGMYFIKKKRHKKKNLSEVSFSGQQYLINRFDLKKEKINTSSIAALTSFIDALIIAGTVYLVIIITDNVALEMLLGLVVIVVLILTAYGIVGRILKKRGFDK